MSRDLRKYSQKTNLGLVIGFLIILFVIGDGLIYWIYGREAAILGLTCMLVGLGPIVIVGIVLSGVEWVLRKTNGGK